MLTFDSPVGTPEERASSKVFPGDWFVYIAYAQHYEYGYHPGVDLNLPGYADSGKPVHAAADGVVVAAGAVPGWQRSMVVIWHVLDGEIIPAVWTRYAHLDRLQVSVLQHVRRGDLLGYIGDYSPTGPVNDHLDFSIARIDLGLKPGDWPGEDLARAKRDYLEPRTFIEAHHPKVSNGQFRVTAADGLRVRIYEAHIAGEIIGVAQAGSVVTGTRDGAWIVVALPIPGVTWQRGGLAAMDARWLELVI